MKGDGTLIGTAGIWLMMAGIIYGVGAIVAILGNIFRKPQSIEISCPSCKALLQIPVEHAGQAGTCNKCGGHIIASVE